MPESIDRELAAFEDDLRRLAPNAGRVDRDALLYEGGRAAAKAGRWRAATAGLAALSLALAVLLAVRPAPPVVERIVYIPVESEEVPEPSPVAPARPAISRQALIEQVFLRGLDGLPDAGVEEAPALLPGWDAFQ